MTLILKTEAQHILEQAQPNSDAQIRQMNLHVHCARTHRHAQTLTNSNTGSHTGLEGFFDLMH